MLRVYAEKEGELLYIIINMNGIQKSYEAGIYDERMIAVFGEDYKKNKKYRQLKARNKCGTYASGLGWYLLRVFLGLTRMRKIDIIKFARTNVKTL